MVRMRIRGREAAKVCKISCLTQKGNKMRRNPQITRHKIMDLLLLVTLLSLVHVLAFAALTSTVSFYMTGQILTTPLVNTFIGQYSNGTYYANDRDSGLTYATDPNYASKLINNAITTANTHSGGGTVQIGSGSFLLNATIVPKSNVYLNVSSGATLYQNTLSSLGGSISLLFSNAGVNNFTLDGGIWNTNKGALSDHRGTSTWSSYFTQYFGIAIYSDIQSNNIIIKNAVLKNVIGQGIDLRTCQNSLISNCSVINAGDNPITIEGPSTSFYSNTVVENCFVNGGQDVGINTWYVSNATIIGNTVANVTQYGGASHWGIAAEQSQGISILSNYISSCEDAIVSMGSNNILIAKNIVNGQNSIGEKAGIHLLDSNNNTVLNNTVSNCDLPLATYPNTQTFNAQFIDNTILNSHALWIAGNNITISGGSINSPTDYNGAICLVSALNVNVLNVTLSGVNGITDYSLNSHYVRVLFCDFTALSGTKVSLGSCTQVYLFGNFGVPDSGTDPL